MRRDPRVYLGSHLRIPWRAQAGVAACADIPGFSGDDSEPFEENVERFVARPEEQFVESARLEEDIRVGLARLDG